MSDLPNAILLFAAGFGTRMAPLTETTPKPLIPVAGRPLLDHARAQCENLRVVVNTHYLADQIKAHLAGSGVMISDETDALLETGGGLKRALPLLDSNPAYTMNTDAVWKGPNPLTALAQAWRPDMEALLLLIPHSAALGHKGTGDFDLSPDNHLTRGTQHVYTGAQIIRTDRLAQIDDSAFSMWRLWDGMFDRRGVFGTLYSGQWCDVGRPDCIALAENMLQGTADV